MRSATATDFQKNFGTWSKDAINEPVAIERHGRPRLVLMSYEHYCGLTRKDAAEPADVLAEDIDPAVMDSLRKFADDVTAPAGIV